MKNSVTSLILIILLGSALPLQAETATREWRFRVFLDDRKIGYHNFTVSEESDLRRIRSEARFELKFLFSASTSTSTTMSSCGTKAV